jgi:hypothetical protein
MNRCFAIALSFLTLTCGALAEPISVLMLRSSMETLSTRTANDTE